MRYSATGLTILATVVSGLLWPATAAPGPASTGEAATSELAFQATQGTWLSLDVTPDGKQLVFELLGDLYSLSTSGGTATTLMAGSAFDSQPSVSPDSQRVAFISDRSGAENLWVANIDGSNPRQLTHEHWGMFASPAWNNDSRSIVVSQTVRGIRSGFELVEYDLQGKLIARHSPANSSDVVDQQISATGAAFSSDGESLFYARRLGRHPRRVTLPVWSIHRLDLHNGHDEQFLKEPGGAFRPEASPDGNWLAYGTRLGHQDGSTAVKLLDLATGTSRVLLQQLDRDDQESEDFNRDVLPGYSFSSDGKSLYITVGGGIKRVSVPDGEITDIPFTAEVQLAIPNTLPLPEMNWPDPRQTARLIQSPELSPDGKRILFSALNSLFLADLPSGQTRKLETVPNAFHPSWSPDGRQMAFVTWTPLEGGAIWLQPVEGDASQARKVTSEPAFYSDLTWSTADELIGLRAPLENRLLNTHKSSAPISELAVFSLQPSSGAIREIARAPDQARYYHRQLSELHGQVCEDSFTFHTHRGLQMLNRNGDLSEPIVQIEGPADFNLVERPRAADDIHPQPNGGLLLAEVREQLFLVPTSSNPNSGPLSAFSASARQLSRFGVDYFGWSRDGKQVYWTLGSTLSILDVSGFDQENLPDTPAIRSAMKQLTIEIPLVRPAQDRQKRLLLTGATLIPMTGAEPLTGKSLLIEGDRIAAVIQDDALPDMSDIDVRDVSGKFILPGFIDLHAHFSVIGRGGVLDNIIAPFLANLAYGVTTVRDPQSFTNDMFAYQDLADSGMILAPRLFTTGPAIQSDHDFTSRRQIRELLTGFRDFYRTNTVKYYLSGNRQQQQWFIAEANSMGLRVTAEGARNFKWDLAKILDGLDGLEHPMPHAPLYQDLLTVLTHTGVTYTPVLAMTPTSHSALHNLERDFRQVPVPEKLQRFVTPSIVANLRSAPDSPREATYFTEQASAARQIVENGGQVGDGAQA